jgi:ABC-type spermidine/putrescine transport system permease subunit I
MGSGHELGITGELTQTPPPRTPRGRRFDLSRLGRLALLLPTILITAVCFLVPLGLIGLYSFGSINQVNFDVYFGWTIKNYQGFTSSLYVHTLLRSVILSVSTTLICAVLGFTFAYFISRQPAKAQRLLLVAVIVPFWTSFIVRTYSWVDLLQNLGPVDRFARATGLVDGHINLLYTQYSIAIGIIYSYLPLMILPIYVSLERIDPALFDASADLGATAWRQFRRVVLPLAVPGLIAGIIIVGVPALGEYVIPEILGGGKTLMAGNILADQFLQTGNYPFGSALAVSVMVVLMLMLFLLRRAQPASEAQ